MKKTLRLLRQGFQTSSGMTPEFKAFAKTFKSELKQELESNRATNIVFSVGHFYLSGFYTVENQAWFFCISDVRFSPEEGVMYRRANNYKDYRL